jgi:hypothetical protein
VSGGQLYPPMDALVSNNYPPASFFLVGLLGQLVGDPILAGRAVALLGFLLVAINIGIWLSLNGVRSSVAILTAAAFVMTLDALAHGMIATDDPQWLAHGLVTTGLVVLWRKTAPTSRVAASAALIMFGGWLKHLVIPLPLALAIWLARTNRRVFWRWTAVAVALAGLLLFATIHGYGRNFLDGVLHAPRRFMIGRSILMAYAVFPALFPISCLAALSWRHLSGNRAAQFALLYFILAALNALIAGGGDGVSENAFFDVAIAASLAAGLTLEEFLPRFSSTYPRQYLLKAALLLPALILAAWMPFGLRTNIERLRSLSAEIQATPADIQFMRQRGAQQAACESLSLCFWSGAPFNIDFFNFGQKIKMGRIPRETCAALFDGTRYTVIQMYMQPTTSNARLPAACNLQIADHYEVGRKSINGVFLVPRPKPPTA